MKVCFIYIYLRIEINHLISQDILQNFRNHPVLKYQETNSGMEIDLWVPKHNIGFEFQVFKNIILNKLFSLFFIYLFNYLIIYFFISSFTGFLPLHEHLVLSFSSV